MNNLIRQILNFIQSNGATSVTTKQPTFIININNQTGTNSHANIPEQTTDLETK